MRFSLVLALLVVGCKAPPTQAPTKAPKAAPAEAAPKKKPAAPKVKAPPPQPKKKARPGLLAFLFGSRAPMPSAPEAAPPPAKGAEAFAKSIAGVWTRDVDDVRMDPRYGDQEALREAAAQRARILFFAMKVDLHADGELHLQLSANTQKGRFVVVKVEGAKGTLWVEATKREVTVREFATIEKVGERLRLSVGDQTIHLVPKDKKQGGHPGHEH